MKGASPAFFRKTGGVRWHARALRYRRLHGPFRSHVGEFLEAWQPQANRLVLVGCSAGWFLPGSFLSRFRSLTCIELDRAAPHCFQLLHGRHLSRAGTSMRWILQDFIDCLPSVLQADTEAAVLFCNVLGQLGMERADFDRQLATLPSRLEGRPWASFHDRFSTTRRHAALRQARAFSSSVALDAAGLQRLGMTGEWIDHGTATVLPEHGLRMYFPWHISPTRFHWIEAGAISPVAAFPRAREPEGASRT
jgi:hypothetical protein